MKILDIFRPLYFFRHWLAYWPFSDERIGAKDAWRMSKKPEPLNEAICPNCTHKSYVRMDGDQTCLNCGWRPKT